MSKKFRKSIPMDLQISDEEMKRMKETGDYFVSINVAGKTYRVDLSKHLPGQHDQSEHGRGGSSTLQEDTGTQIGRGEQSAPKEPAKPKEDTFDRAKWDKLDPGKRRDEWEKLPAHQRDVLADAKKTVPAREKQLLDGITERPNTGKLSEDLGARVDQFKDRIHPEAAEKIKKVVSDYENNLRGIEVADDVRREITMAAADSLACQEMEACTRQLGDHGSSHIEGNIRMGLDALSKVPGSNTPEDQATLRTAMIFHDTGYLAPPSQMFMDEGHPRWSAQHYDENLRPTVEKALGSIRAGEVSRIISSHDSKELDWKEQPVASASRLADNLALFHKEKLPPIMRYVDGNTQLLKDLAAGKIDAKQCRQQMLQNVAGSDLPNKMKSLLNKGVMEVSEFSPKFALGMLGGEVSGMKWNGTGMDVSLKENKETTELNKLGDFGQKQFAKFADTYGYKKEDFLRDLSFEFKDSEGKVLLRGLFEKIKGWITSRRKEKINGKT